MKELIMVPKDRTAVIKSKDTKSKFEGKLNIKISVVDNAVELDGEDGLSLYQGRIIIKAIARGFSPERAQRLLEEDAQFEIVDMGNLTDRKMKTIKSRVIGTEGKMRETIEMGSGSFVSVYGKTISLIGTYEQNKIAKKAIKMIIDGAMLTSVRRFLLKNVA